MSFGHIVIEGYCHLEENEEAEVPCKDVKYGTVSHYCLCSGADEKRCEYFAGWCKTSNYIVATDNKGNELVCSLYKHEEKEKIINFVNKINNE